MGDFSPGDAMTARLLLVIFFASLPNLVSAEPRPTPFDEGNVSFSGGLGVQVSAGGSYVVVSLGTGYYIVKGLELNLMTAAWLAHDPFVATFTPGVRYVLWQVPGIHPYLGGFFRYWYVGGDSNDQQSAGGRLGITTVQGNVGINAGIVYERILSDCFDCSSIYPEMSFSLSF